MCLCFLHGCFFPDKNSRFELKIFFRKFSNSFLILSFYTVYNSTHKSQPPSLFFSNQKNPHPCDPTQIPGSKPQNLNVHLLATNIKKSLHCSKRKQKSIRAIICEFLFAFIWQIFAEVKRRLLLVLLGFVNNWRICMFRAL